MMELATPRLIIRLADYRDAAAIARYYRENRAFLKPYEPVRSEEFFTSEFWHIQIESNLLEFEHDVSLRLFLFEQKAPRDVIGVINFTQFFRAPFYSCQLGYSLAAPQQGNGLMQEALRTAIDHVFNDLNFHRIMATYMPRNQRSGNVLKALGFNVEGYARDYLQIDGKWEDHILTSRINSHWHPE
jgi:ribosomal-protein-alanine N-acetyltransferase